MFYNRYKYLDNFEMILLSIVSNEKKKSDECTFKSI